VLTYGVAGFRTEYVLVSLGAAKTHCALYVMSPATQKRFAAQLKGFSTSAGTVRFTVEQPLPKALVTALVKARVAENTARASAKRPAKATPSRKRLADH